jgi:hypothetical protein
MFSCRDEQEIYPRKAFTEVLRRRDALPPDFIMNLLCLHLAYEVFMFIIINNGVRLLKMSEKICEGEISQEPWGIRCFLEIG